MLTLGIIYAELPGTKSPPEFCPQRAVNAVRTGHQGTAGVHTARVFLLFYIYACLLDFTYKAYVQRQNY